MNVKIEKLQERVATAENKAAELKKRVNKLEETVKKLAKK